MLSGLKFNLKHICLVHVTMARDEGFVGVNL